MRRNSLLGFSLVELLVAIAIVAILVAAAFPSFEGSLRRNRLATTTNELIASVSLARSEAIRSTDGGGVCASADGLACGSDWNAGWLVWVDGGNNAANHGSFQSASDTVVRVVNAHPRLVLAASNASATPISSIGFDYRGRPVTGAATTFQLKPDTCPAGQELVRALAINISGQIVNQKGVCP